MVARLNISINLYYLIQTGHDSGLSLFVCQQKVY